MEQNSRKNDDCYFYYYSTCLKGDNCLFRHEENALGCEVVCQYWKEGKCLNERCNFRHMELKKNRKVIPCYWETQPGGCRKPHCPFRHLNQKDKPPDKTKDGNVGGTNMVMPGVLNVQGNQGGRNLNTDGGVPGPTVVRGDLNYAANPVDPIVVKFEEESDNESVPSSSPFKLTSSVSSSLRQKPSSPLRVKTLEEIRLEKIQKESAAYYNIDDPLEYPSRGFTDMSDESLFNNDRKKKSLYTDCKVLTLDEIRRNRQKRLASLVHGNDQGMDDIYREGKTKINFGDGMDGDDLCERSESKIIKLSVLPDSTSEENANDGVADCLNINTETIKIGGVNSSTTSSEKTESGFKSCNERESCQKSKDDFCVNPSLAGWEVKSEALHNDVESPNHRLKPVKLRRFLKRSVVDGDNVNLNRHRRRNKRIKLNDEKEEVCSSSVSNCSDVVNDDINKDTDKIGNVFQMEHNDDSMDYMATSSPIENNGINGDIDCIDIIKDIDELLNN